VILDDLDSNYASTTEVAQLYQADPRTVRRMAKAGKIPSIRIGNRIMIPVPWLREQATEAHAEPEPFTAGPDLDQLVDLAVGRAFADLVSRLARAFAALASSEAEAGDQPLQAVPSPGGPGAA
jgi:excisionase family DNA binding protein